MSLAPGRPHPLPARPRRLKSAPTAGRGAQRARPPPVHLPPATRGSARHRELLEPLAVGPSGSGCGRETGSNIKKGAWCQVSGITPLTPDTRHLLPHRTQGNSLKIEQTFQIMRPYEERLEQLLPRAARVFADQGYHPTT